MLKYLVNIREIHIQPVKIEADSPESAIEKVRKGGGFYDLTLLEYCRSLDSEFWTVEEEEEKDG